VQDAPVYEDLPLDWIPETINVQSVNTAETPTQNDTPIRNAPQQNVSIRKPSEVKPLEDPPKEEVKPKEDTPKLEVKPKEDPPEVEKWIKMRYSAPAEYDKNNDGILDASERAAAEADGKLHIDSIAVVRGPHEDAEVIEEQFYSRPRTRRRRRSKKKLFGKSRRKSRR